MTVRSALVVDDSKSARFALRRYLEGHRYQVETAESADEANRLLAASRPGVIFLDHVMPGVDGFSVLRSLKANEQTAAIPVVVCSSNEGPEFNAQARASGASFILQKPPNPEHLQRILDDLERPDPAHSAGAATPEAVAAGSECAPVHSAAPPEVPAMSGLRPSMPAVAAVPAATDDAIREQLEARMKKVSQGLFVQFAEIKATVAHLSSQQARLAEQPGSLRSELRGGLDETNQALRLVNSRIEGIEREVFSQLTAMRTHLESTLKAQAERITDLVQSARQAAAEEAQIVAERTVMSAALRISDQLADAILGAAGRR